MSRKRSLKCYITPTEFNSWFKELIILISCSGWKINNVVSLIKNSVQNESPYISDAFLTLTVSKTYSASAMCLVKALHARRGAGKTKTRLRHRKFSLTFGKGECVCFSWPDNLKLGTCRFFLQQTPISDVLPDAVGWSYGSMATATLLAVKNWCGTRVEQKAAPAPSKQVPWSSQCKARQPLLVYI